MTQQISGGFFIGSEGSHWPPPGETVEVPDEEGKTLCENGLAEPVAQRKKTETATTKKLL